jgi:23S rRNA pseudouridine1911/1915/1917 synthase
MRPVDAPAPLLSFLFATWPETKKKQVREWLKHGSVAVNDRIVTQFDHPLKRGDRVTIHRKGMAAPETKLQGGIRIRHEDADILVIEKPSGLLSIASASEEDKTAYAMLTRHVRRGNERGRERVWIVHWDDAEKKYFAIVEGVPPQESGTLETWLDESNPLKVYVGGNGPQMRHAITHYRVQKKGKGTTLLEVTLETGRRHQIRAQLAQAGCPIVGDGKYGAETDPIKRVALHACSLRFTHPTTQKPMRFESPLPGELGALV